MADDVVTLIRRDHRTMEKLFEQVKAGKSDRQALLEQIETMLAAHSRAEETQVYPVISRAAPEERPEVRHGAEEHAEAEELLRAAMRAGPDGAGFAAKFERFVEAVRHHVEEEETQLLPSLRAAVAAGELERLGRHFAEHRQKELDSASGQ